MTDENSLTQSPPRKATNWNEWFDSRDSVTMINQNAQEELLKTFDASLSSKECETKLKEYQ